jgi:hypothetical protein
MTGVELPVVKDSVEALSRIKTCGNLNLPTFLQS